MYEKLNKSQIDQFISDGFIRIDNAFDNDTAMEVRNILWRDLNRDPDRPETWDLPVVRLGMYTQEVFVRAANTPFLHRAFDQLIGTENWIPLRSMGTFPVRFPSLLDPGDTGWHVDASFPGNEPADYFKWRVNIKSRGRALLMLFLFSDVGDSDAPTRIKIGSHLDVGKLLTGYGDEGLSFMELADSIRDLPPRKEAVATGRSGTVYLCHPFIVHSAQLHRGTNPKFMSQPPLLLKRDLSFDNSTGDHTPLKESIRIMLKA